ncbi:MAG: hypothetical protein ACO1OG_03010 [Devosia sp.]
MSPTRLPRPAPRRHLRRLFANPLSAATAIGFSLTFVGAGGALLLGFVPDTLLLGAQSVDTGVVLLLVPLCALLVTLMAEAVRASLNNGITAPPARKVNALGAWRPGQGEG